MNIGNETGHYQIPADFGGRIPAGHGYIYNDSQGATRDDNQIKMTMFSSPNEFVNKIKEFRRGYSDAQARTNAVVNFLSEHGMRDTAEREARRYENIYLVDIFRHAGVDIEQGFLEKSRKLDTEKGNNENIMGYAFTGKEAKRDAQKRLVAIMKK